MDAVAVARPILPKGSKTYIIHPRVPAEYRAVVGASHVTRSLGTGDLREARRRASAAMEKLFSEWDGQLGKDRAEAEPSAKDAGRITAKAGFYFDNIEHARAFFYDRACLIEQVRRGELKERILQNPEAFWRGEIITLPQEPLDDDLLIAAALAFRRHAAFRYKRLSGALAMGALDDIQRLVRASFNPPHSEDIEFVVAMARTLLSFLKRVSEDDSAVYAYVDEVDGTFILREPTDGGFPTAPPAPRSKPGTPNLSALCEAYIRERGDGLSGERADTIKAAVRDLIEVIGGDKSVTEYGREDANAFKAVLLALPGNWIKRKGLREHGIVEASRRAALMRSPRQAVGTLQKKWSVLGSLFSYAERNYDGVKNPFQASSLAVSDGRADNEKCDPFRPDELGMLLGSLRPALPSHLHWLTLLGLYTGARLNELCQLRKSLILRHGDVDYVYFSPELRLKTRRKQSCVRSVPIHPQLIELGFLEYVKSCTEQLFPGLPLHKSGRLSDGPSKAFTRHLTQIGMKRPKLSFNSLRHTFIETMKRSAPRDAETRERLVGHALGGLAGRYGASYTAEALDMQLLIERAKVLAHLQFSTAQSICDPTKRPLRHQPSC